VPYRFLDDAPTADTGFAASGATLDECFRAAADATLATMLANPESLRAAERRSATVRHEDLDLALVKLLDEIVYHKDAEGLLLRASDVRVERRADEWVATALLEGEAIDPSRHELAADVKAVTVHRLRVARSADGWEATVVLDI
jgi:SHS2 domain-containing protein